MRKSKAFTRRKFLTALSAATAGLASLGSATVARAEAEEQGAGHAGMDHAMDMDPLQDRFPRRDPNVTLSDPPRLMGRGMGRVETPGIPPLGYDMDDGVKVFELVAQPVETAIIDASSLQHAHVPPAAQRFRPRPTQPKTMLAWGYNGCCPGPTLEATEGDRVRIVLRNELPEPTSIHWHGFELPFSQDGASGYHPFEARRPVMPGATEVYEFDVLRPGTLMYHTGFNVMKQQGLGLGGMFVVHARQNEPRIDKDFAIMLQQWSFRPGNPNPDVNAMEPSFATFNGKTAPAFPNLEVEQGDRVRIRFANLSLMFHPIHLHGYVFEIVGTGGGSIPRAARWKDVTVTIGPGETRDIELVAWNPGTWRMHCHVLHHLMNQMPNAPMGIAPHEGMFTHLEVNPKRAGYDPRSPDAPWSYPRGGARI